MNLKDTYNNISTGFYPISGEDYRFVEILSRVYVGVDKEDFVSVAFKTSDSTDIPIIQKTKLLMLKCCIEVTIEDDNLKKNEKISVITCFSKEKKDIEIFLDLCDVLFLSNGDVLSSDVLDIFNTLSVFFADRTIFSYKELQGLFTELYTMKLFYNYSMNNYWHIEEMAKFDFSINSNFKIEIKSTTSAIRKHRFSHEQIYNQISTIFVLSYVLRTDEYGLSLYDLIMDVINYDFENLTKRLILSKVLKNVEITELKSMKFDENSLLEGLRIINAQEIPKFKESTPLGVSNAKYDCVLDNVKFTPLEEFESYLRIELSKSHL